jgi:hypothetical protein
VLNDLERELQAADEELEELARQSQQYDVLSKVCESLEELNGLHAAQLFWNSLDGADKTTEHVQDARRNIEQFNEEVARVEDHRQSIVDKINAQNENLDYLHYDLRDALAREESRESAWVVEREPDELPSHTQVMPWARGCEEDERFRKSLLSSVAAALVLMLLFSMITLPILERAKVNELPERVAKLVREERLPPPPPEPVEELTEPDEDIPEEEPELADEEPPPEDLPESAEQPAVAEAAPEATREKVKSKGILAFRDSFANRANLTPSAQLGSQARVTNAGEDAIGRTERSMVTSNAPGSSGGINLSSISRSVGGGGKGIGGVQVSRVASSIGGGDGPARPLSGGAAAGRTDEEIQIVFDRYKASLYRLYNRELRNDPTLRGQMILRLTIEPDGSVSLCELESSDMDAPTLAQQVVSRVRTFDFGVKEDVVAMTIIYPIDFLPAA